MIVSRLLLATLSAKKGGPIDGVCVGGSKNRTSILGWVWREYHNICCGFYGEGRVNTQYKSNSRKIYNIENGYVSECV